MRLKHLKPFVFFFLCILGLLTIKGCGKSPIENTIEDLVDANNDDEMDNEDKDDDNDNDDDDQPITTFAASINETEFIASTLLSQSLTGAAVNIGNAGYTMVITGQYLSQDLKSTQIIIIYAFGVDFDELAANTEFNIVSNILGTEVPGAFAIYGGDPDTENDGDNFGTEVLEEIRVKITAIDKEKRLLSGEFSFVVLDEDTNQEYKVTDGVFSNLEYDLQ